MDQYDYWINVTQRISSSFDISDFKVEIAHNSQFWNHYIPAEWKGWLCSKRGTHWNWTTNEITIVWLKNEDVLNCLAIKLVNKPNQIDLCQKLNPFWIDAIIKKSKSINIWSYDSTRKSFTLIGIAHTNQDQIRYPQRICVNLPQFIFHANAWDLLGPMEYMSSANEQEAINSLFWYFCYLFYRSIFIHACPTIYYHS